MLVHTPCLADVSREALPEATQAYAGFQMAGDSQAMAECVRLVAHGLQRQGARRRAIQRLDELRQSLQRAQDGQ